MVRIISLYSVVHYVYLADGRRDVGILHQFEDVTKAYALADMYNSINKDPTDNYWVQEHSYFPEDDKFNRIMSALKTLKEQINM